ncbi:hypothetical protein BH24DEI2_BH24DEI2_16830 [soil metagenome]
MDWEEISRNWKGYRKEAMRTWTKLQDEDLNAVAGDRDKLIQQVEKAHAVSLEAAETEVDAWAKRMTEIQAT